LTTERNIIPCLISAAAKKFHSQSAIISPDKTISYERYDRQVSRVANNLTRASVQQNDRVAVVAVTKAELPLIIMGIVRLGAAACLLSPRLPAQAILENAREAACRFIITPDVENAVEDPSPLNTVELLANSSGDIQHSEAFDFDREAAVVWTSGSSAHPKPVVLTGSNLYYNALGANQNMPFQPGDRWLLSLPLYHVGGLSILFRALLGGGAVVVPDVEKTLAENIIYNKITHVSLVATQLYRLLEDKNMKKTIKFLRAVLLGGGFFPQDLIDSALSYDLPLHRSYGLTEAASQVTTTSRADIPRKLKTSGRPLEYRQVKISEENEILVKGEVLFKGYLEPGGLTKPFDSEGWFHTGDSGFLDAEGCLNVTGRRDNMFISGGENIQPEEIENRLCRREDIIEAVVVPVADSEFGFRPAAFVRTRDNREPDAAKIKSYLEEHLPRFKIPVNIYGWPQGTKNGELKTRREFFIEEARRRSG
jgi:O-succinylbenzoic acid--CoA ligase